MEKKVLDAAYGGLLHDIGKPYQRSVERSDLSEQELQVTPIYKGLYHSHLHAGYTSRFLTQYLGMFNAFESAISSHHLNDNRPLTRQIIRADHIASSIDRNDEESDIDDKNNKGDFRQVRLSSIFEEVDFGKDKDKAMIGLTKLEEMDYPQPLKHFRKPNKVEAACEYQEFFNQFLEEVKQDPYLYKRLDRRAYSRMYSLLYQYMTSVPASTYEGNETYVSLFDHLKLTSAIASCLAVTEDIENPTFRMLEFDVSGIQKFIFRVTEGSDTKKQVAKSLRGRSFLVSLITECITMSFLHEFGMTEANIIFNTGGGALLLLPDSDDFEKRAKKVSSDLMKALFDQFHTDLTFVYASVICSGDELEKFKVEKAVELKGLLEEAKANKFIDIMGDHAQNSAFFYVPVPQNKTCELCGAALKLEEEGRCSICVDIIRISEYLLRNNELVLLFSFDASDQDLNAAGVQIHLGACTATLTSRSWIEQAEKSGKINLNDFDGIESINHDWMGSTRYIALSVPLTSKGEIMPMDEICNLAGQEEWGDPKLGILKMDVDNLGSIFAYGLDQKTRSLSKFLMLSRMMEFFFGNLLPEICLDISQAVNENIDEKTENGTMFYINYAGGDDLVILGPAAGILQLAEAINDCLNSYTLNQNITISGGIFIQRPAQPIRFGVLEAEKLLSMSKENPGKNSISLIHSTLSFDEFSEVLNQVDEWKQVIDGGGNSRNSYSRTGFYRLMKLLDVSDLREYNRRVPIALYTVCRNAKDKAFEEEMKQMISSVRYVGSVTKAKDLKVVNANDRSERTLQKIILEMKLTIMQTRD